MEFISLYPPMTSCPGVNRNRSMRKWRRRLVIAHTSNVHGLSVLWGSKRICSTMALWLALQPKDSTIWHCAKVLHLSKFPVGMSGIESRGSALWCKWWLSDLAIIPELWGCCYRASLMDWFKNFLCTSHSQATGAHFQRHI